MVQFMDEKQIKHVLKKRDRLLASAKTLGISVLVDEGDVSFADIGYAPFIRADGNFYIYSSHLSSHIRALINGSEARFFLIEDEEKSINIWARVRLKFSAEVLELARDDKRFSSLCSQIGQVHGPVMEIIRNFEDFHLFEIHPRYGTLVTGFAQAFKVNGPAFELTEHLRNS
tara:strand:- start:119 stop:634 length:516 start_codon:yes stop_codon:yes gene_type:complete